MKERIVGKIKNLTYNDEKDSLDIVITITDPVFKKQFLRNLMLAGNLSFNDDKLIFVESEDIDAKV